MSVRKLSIDGDWTFGRSLRDYYRESDEVHQNVRTRVKSWFNDWFLGVDEYIDWENLLGNKNTEENIIKQVERCVLNTNGVANIISLDINTDTTSRNATIKIEYNTLFDKSFKGEFNIL